MVLKFLEKGPHSGYALMDAIEKITSTRPSAGSIYPLLDNLSKEGIVISNEKGKSKIYSLTKVGKKKLTQISKQKIELVEKITGLAQIMGNVCETHESEFFSHLINHIKTGEIPFMHLEPEISEFREALVVKSKKKNKYSKKLKSILKKTAREIKDLK